MNLEYAFILRFYSFLLKKVNIYNIVVKKLFLIIFLCTLVKYPTFDANHMYAKCC